MIFRINTKRFFYKTIDTLPFNIYLLSCVKVEKNPGEGSEIEPETVCLQAVGGLCRRKAEGLTACLLHNEPASYFRVARLSLKGTEPERKRVRIGRSVARSRPEAK